MEVNSTETVIITSYILEQGLTHRIAIGIGSLGILLNLLSLIILARKRGILSNIPRIIVNNQCAADLLAGIFLIYFQYHSWYLGTEIPELVPNKRLFCHMVWSTFLLWAPLQVSSWNLQVLTVERYLSVCYPFRHQTVFTRRGTIAILVGIWLGGYGFIGAFLPNLMKYYGEANICIFSPEPAMAAWYSSLFLVHSYLLNVLLTVLCYTRMLLEMRRRVRSLDMFAKIARAKERKNRNFIITCAFINVAYFLCYSCNVIYLFLGTNGVIVMIPDSTIYQLSVIAVFVNCFINPVVFTVKMASFRVELLRLVTCGRLALLNTVSSSTLYTASTGLAAARGTQVAPMQILEVGQSPVVPRSFHPRKWNVGERHGGCSITFL